MTNNQNGQPGSIHIQNLTARRIGIERSGKVSGNLSHGSGENLKWFVIPPFGKRTIEPEESDNYNYKPWEKLNLVRVKREAIEEEETSAPFEYKGITVAIGIIFSFYIMIFGIVYLIFSLLGSAWDDHWVKVGTLSIITLVVGMVYDLKKNKDFTSGFRKFISNVWEKIKKGLKVTWRWGNLLISLLPILAVGIGLPGLVIYLFGNGKNLLENLNDFVLLGRGLQFIFIATASLLPALMYFLFTHNELEKLQDNFFREIVHLDPRVITLDDAKSLYENKVSAVYGSEESSSVGFPYGMRSPIFIATLVITVGWIFTLSPFGDIVGKNLYGSFFSPAPTPLVFGFLGAYFFGLSMLFRRYVRADLRPKVYTHFTVRIFIVIILVWVLSMIPWSGIIPKVSDNNMILLPLAFIIGIFPETGLAVIGEYLRTFGFFRHIIRLEEEDSLERLEGINIYHRAQLLEEGIENIENLAHHDLIDLMLQTRIPVPRLVDWIDQAILHLHVGDTAAQRATATKQYLFSWDEIPGNDDCRFKEFLRQNFSANWVKTAKIVKDDDDMTIKASFENNSLLLKLNDEKTEATLIINDKRTDEFIVNNENGKLNIYEKQRHSHWLPVFQRGEKRRTGATNESLRTLRMYGIRTATDLDQAVKMCKGNEAEELFKSMEGSENKIKRFQVILNTLKDDEWMAYVRHWRDTEKFTNRIFTIDDFREELYPEAQNEKSARLDTAIVVAPSSENSQLSPIPQA